MINNGDKTLYKEYINQNITSILVVHKNIVLLLLEEEINLYYIDKYDNIHKYSEYYESK